MTINPIRFAAVGLDHRHIFGMSAGMIDAGCECVCFWTQDDPQPMAGFRKRFPDVPRVADLERVLEDPSIDLVIIAAPPAARAELALQMMRHGKDVMLDKPGCLTPAELAKIEACIVETGRIWSVNFSERFEVPAVTLADRLLAEGRIGKVVQTLSMAPHRLNAQMRPDWFWDPKDYGGIIGDIGTHQIDQFLHFTGARDARICHTAVGNMKNPAPRGEVSMG